MMTGYARRKLTVLFFQGILIKRGVNPKILKFIDCCNIKVFCESQNPTLVSNFTKKCRFFENTQKSLFLNVKFNPRLPKGGGHPS